jgi:predicted transcriptional regulator
MKVIISGMGMYVGRIIKGVKTIKPDIVYLCVQKPQKRKLEDYQTDSRISWLRYSMWEKVMRTNAKKIAKKLESVYEKKDIRIVEIDIDDYLTAFEDLLKLVLSFKPDTKIYIDATVPAFPYRAAAITLAILFKNVDFIYTPGSEPSRPTDYSKEAVMDKGLTSRIMPAPKVDFSEIQTGVFKDILVKINTRFKGEAPSVTDLVLELGMTNEKGNMIKMSKLLDKLERYGCIKTKKEGRLKKVELTMIGSSISNVLKNL